MERRDFIKALAASGALGAAPWSTLAAAPLSDPGLAMPLTIVGQADLPHAAALAGSLARMLAAAGMAPVQAPASGDELADCSAIVALLDRAPSRHLIGVMDDAAAVVFQAVAAARGAGYVLRTHHRLLGGDVRHCCTAVGLDSSVVWSDPIQAQAARIGRLYAAAISRRTLPPGLGVPAAGDGTALPPSASPVSLVSFVINT